MMRRGCIQNVKVKK